MNSEETRGREERAFEALVVSQISSHCDNENIAPDALPELTDEELAAMNSLGGDFMARLIADYDSKGQIAEDESKPKRKRESRIRGVVHGMNRADEIGTEAAMELERKRAEALGEIQKKADEEEDDED